MSTDDITIIHKYHANETSISAQEYFELELEEALESGRKFILIESKELGEETARWIHIGHFLQKSALVSGLASIWAAYATPDRPVLFCPMAAYSLLACGLHTLSWRPDPCSRYKVVRYDEINDKVFRWLTDLMCCTDDIPVILYRDTPTLSETKSLLQRAISFLAFTFSTWRFYRLVKFAA